MGKHLEMCLIKPNVVKTFLKLYCQYQMCFFPKIHAMLTLEIHLSFRRSVGHLKQCVPQLYIHSYFYSYINVSELVFMFIIFAKSFWTQKQRRARRVVVG